MERNYLQKVHRNEVTSKWRGNLLIFSLWRIDLIPTSNRHRFDVVCPLGNKYSKSPVIKTHIFFTICFFILKRFICAQLIARIKTLAIWNIITIFPWSSLPLWLYSPCTFLSWCRQSQTCNHLIFEDLWLGSIKFLLAKNSTIKFPSDNT